MQRKVLKNIISRKAEMNARFAEVKQIIKNKVDEYQMQIKVYKLKKKDILNISK